MHITWCDFGLKKPLLAIIPVSWRGLFFLAVMFMIFFLWFEKEQDSFLQDFYFFSFICF